MRIAIAVKNHLITSVLLKSGSNSSFCLGHVKFRKMTETRTGFFDFFTSDARILLGWLHIPSEIHVFIAMSNRVAFVFAAESHLSRDHRIWRLYTLNRVLNQASLWQNFRSRKSE